MKAGAADVLEEFKNLEERIAQVLEVLQKTREEKNVAETGLTEAQQQIALLQKDIEALRAARGVVRGRVESLIESISELSEKQVV